MRRGIIIGKPGCFKCKQAQEMLPDFQYYTISDGPGEKLWHQYATDDIFPVIVVLEEDRIISNGHNILEAMRVMKE